MRETAFMRGGRVYAAPGVLGQSGIYAGVPITQGRSPNVIGVQPGVGVAVTTVPGAGVWQGVPTTGRIYSQSGVIMQPQETFGKQAGRAALTTAVGAGIGYAIDKDDSKGPVIGGLIGLGVGVLWNYYKSNQYRQQYQYPYAYPGGNFRFGLPY